MYQHEHKHEDDCAACEEMLHVGSWIVLVQVRWKCKSPHRDRDRARVTEATEFPFPEIIHTTVTYNVSDSFFGYASRGTCTLHTGRLGVVCMCTCTSSYS